MNVWGAGSRTTSSAPTAAESSRVVEKSRLSLKVRATVLFAVSYGIASYLISAGIVAWAFASNNVGHQGGWIFLFLPFAPLAVPVLLGAVLINLQVWGFLVALLLIVVTTLISLPLQPSFGLPRHTYRETIRSQGRALLSLGLAWLATMFLFFISAGIRGLTFSDVGLASGTEFPWAAVFFPALWLFFLWLAGQMPYLGKAK